MKKHSFILLVFLFIICTASKCKKETSNPNSDDGLPPATQTGANIFACKVNGKPWISGSDIYILAGGVSADTLFATGSIGDLTYFERLTLKINGHLSQGATYPIDNTGVNFLRLSTNKSCTGNLGTVINSSSVNGRILLTKLDTTHKIISGTFIGTIPVPNCDTFHITNGRFDIKYY